MRLQGVQKLKESLRRSEEYRNTYYTRQEWAEYEDLWEGEYNLRDLKDGGENQTLTVPILVSDNQRQMASIFGSDPRIVVTSDNPEQYAASQVLGIKLTNMVSDLGLMSQLRDGAQDAGTCGTGFVMTGFGSQYGTHPDTVLDGFDSSRTDAKGNRIEFHDSVKDNMPWTLRAHPAEILLPPGIARIEEAHGYFHIYQRHKDDLDADDKLIAKHRHKLEPDSSYDNLTRTSNRTTGMAMFANIGNPPGRLEADLCTLVDWLDFRTNHRVTFSPYYPYALRDEIDEVLIRLERLPLEPIIFTHASRGFWGTSDFKMQMSIANEYNDIRTMQTKHRRGEILKALVDVNAFMLDGETQEDAKTAIERLSDDQVDAIIAVNSNPNDVIAFVTGRQPYDFPQQLEICEKNIREYGSGVGPLQQGQMSSGRHTKYETQSAEANYEQAITPRRKVISKVIINTVMNWSSLIYDFWTEPQLVRTHDAAGNPVTVEFNGGDLRGDYRFQVSLDSMRSRSHAEQKEEANMLLSQLQPYTQPGPDGMPIVNPKSLVRQYIAKVTDGGWDIEDLMEGAQPPQGPPQQFGQFQQGFQQQEQQQPGLNQLMQQMAGGAG